MRTKTITLAMPEESSPATRRCALSAERGMATSSSQEKLGEWKPAIIARFVRRCM